MRIDTSNVTSGALPQEAGRTTGSTSGRTESSVSVPIDTATISSGGSAVHPLTAQAMQASSARGMRVDTLRQAVASGNYAPDASSIADAMVGESE